MSEMLTPETVGKGLKREADRLLNTIHENPPTDEVRELMERQLNKLHEYIYELEGE